jgi:hypothetical protein
VRDAGEALPFAGEYYGRMLLYRILQAIASLTKKNTDVRLRWVPAHDGIVGNEEADEAAREASSREGKPSAPALERIREVEGVIRLINRDRSDNPTPFDSTRLAGQYTWKMDQALPGKHTLRLYGALTSDQLVRKNWIKPPGNKLKLFLLSSLNTVLGGQS